MERINKQLLLVVYIMFQILYVNVGCCLVKYEIVNLKNYSLGLIPLLIINGIIILIVLFYKIFHHQIKFKILDFFLIGILIFSIISTIFAIDVNYALFGITGRYEGLFSILYYLSIFYLSSYIDYHYKKIIIYVILLCGFIQAIYGILQLNFIRIFHIKIIRTIHDYQLWIDGFISNPNFFGSYMLLCLSYTIGLFVNENKDILIKLLYILLMITFMIGILISNTLSALVGLFGVLFYLIFYLMKEKKYIRFLIILIVLILVTFVTYKSGKTTLIKDVNKTMNETKEIAKLNVDDTYGTKRMFIWKRTLSVVPKYIIHGVGIDNFIRAFDGKALIRKYEKNGVIKYSVYDKAHNEYLQILITEGIFALLFYLLFYGFIVFAGIKNSFITGKVFLILPIIGYLIQAFFNISVIEVAPIFYISLGLCVDRGKLWKK